MATASTTWLATSGNGAATGIAPIISNNLPRTAPSRETRKALKCHSIPPSRQRKSAFKKAVRFFAPTNIAPATWWAHAARAKSILGPTTSDSAARKRHNRSRQDGDQQNSPIRLCASPLRIACLGAGACERHKRAETAGLRGGGRSVGPDEARQSARDGGLPRRDLRQRRGVSGACAAL